MKHIACILFVLALCSPGIAGELITVQLNDGQIVQGEVVTDSQTSDGFSLRRLDTGGVVKIAWEQVTVDQAESIRGVRNADGSLYAAEALKGLQVVTSNNVYEGIVVSEEEEVLRLLTSEREKQIPVHAIEKRIEIEIDPVDLYGLEAYYDLRKVEIDPEDALQQWEFADFCERLRLYRQAMSHYEASVALDPEREKVLEQKRPVLEKLVREQFADEQLRDLENVIAVGNFDAARAIVSQLAEYGDTESVSRYPDLNEYVIEQEKAFEADREAFLVKHITDDWMMLTRKVSRRVSRTYGQFNQIRSYVSNGMHREIRSLVAAKYGIEPSEAERFFELREDTGKHRTARLGSGTWAVEGAPGGQDAGAGGQGRGGGNSGRSNDFERGVAQALETGDSALLAEIMRGGSGGGSGGNTVVGGGSNPAVKPPIKVILAELESEQEYWKRISTSTKYGIVEGWYAAQNLRVVEEKPRVCSGCDGDGSMRSSIGREILCDRCHGLGHDLSVRYY